jgi:hypothetical protein
LDQGSYYGWAFSHRYWNWKWSKGKRKEEWDQCKGQSGCYSFQRSMLPYKVSWQHLFDL